MGDSYSSTRCGSFGSNEPAKRWLTAGESHGLSRYPGHGCYEHAFDPVLINARPAATPPRTGQFRLLPRGRSIT
jgi:hypothetical protein